MTNSLPYGWTEVAPNQMATNNDPHLGGIIDSAIVSGKWFVIFNSDKIESIDGLETRTAAFDAHANAVKGVYWVS